MNPITSVFKRYRLETIFHKEIKDHNSDNNWWILSLIKLDLHFMITYLCIKYESNTPVYSKDIEIYLAPSLSEVSHIIDSIYPNKLILSLSVSCKQLAGLNVVSNSFGVVIFWGIKLGDSKI